MWGVGDTRQHAGVEEIVWRRYGDLTAKVAGFKSQRGWIPCDERSKASDGQLMLPRTVHVARFLRAAEKGVRRKDLKHVRNMAHYKAAAERFVQPYGPLRSKIAVWEDDDPILEGPRYGCWHPVSDQWLGEGYDPAPGTPGGRWISPYQGRRNALDHWNLHVRTMDRMTTERYGIESMLDEQGLARSERYSLQARHRPEASVLPSGAACHTAEGLLDHPMVKWQSSCGNGGYDAQHLIRAYRHAMALASHYPDAAWMVEPDIVSLARDVELWLSPYAAKKDAWGPGDNPSYMYRESLAYRSRTAQPIVRDLGWASYLIAWAYQIDSDRFDHIAGELLDFWEDTVLPCGFSQASRYHEESDTWDTQPPRPDAPQYNVPRNHAVSQEIEAPIALAGMCALDLNLHGGDLTTTRSPLAKVAAAYLHEWPDTGAPTWPKWWGVGDANSWFAYAAPHGKGDNFNGWLVMELALRFTKHEKIIRERKGLILDLWDAHKEWRPWMAGLVGALS